MKNIFLITAIFWSFGSFANEVAPKCKADIEANPKVKTMEGSSNRIPGSSKFSSCLALSRGHMEKLYSPGGNRKQFDWKPLLEYACKDKCQDKGTPGGEFSKCYESAEKEAKSCESIAYVMSTFGRDWNNEDHYQQVTSSSRANAAQQVGNGQVNAAQAAAMAASIKCLSQGIETIDYDDCKKFTDQLEVIEAVQTVSYGVQETVYKSKMSDAAIKYGSEENTATGALKATADSLKNQQDMYQQRSAVDATKLAYLYSIYNDIPTNEDAQNKCQNIQSAATSSGLTISPQECKNAVSSGRGGFALNQNGPMRDQMRTKLIAIATSLGSNTMLANLMGKRADDANNAIAKIDAFTPTDPATVTEEEAKTTFCKQNPGLPQCLTGDLDQAFGTISDNVLTFGDGGLGTTYGDKNSIGNGTTSNSGETSTERNTVDPMGSAIAAANHDNSIEASKGATVTSSGNGGSTPSGGGGSASASSGSGGLPNAQGAGAGAAPTAGGKVPTYAGGDGVSVIGGFGINKAKSEGKTDDNPFGKLFGKDSKGGSEMNFRDPASQRVGGQKDNLFEMISKRYTTVTADKRLLEYELAK